VRIARYRKAALESFFVWLKPPSQLPHFTTSLPPCSISIGVITFSKINYSHNTAFWDCDLCKTNLRSCIRKYLHWNANTTELQLLLLPGDLQLQLQLQSNRTAFTHPASVGCRIRGVKVANRGESLAKPKSVASVRSPRPLTPDLWPPYAHSSRMARWQVGINSKNVWALIKDLSLGCRWRSPVSLVDACALDPGHRTLDAGRWTLDTAPGPKAIC